MVETGPRRQAKDPKSLKLKKKGNVAQVEGSSFGGTVQVVQVVKKAAKEGQGWLRAQVERRPRGEDGGKCNATIVVATTSCGIARSGRKLRRNFVPPREKTSPAPFAHTDGSPGWNPWTDSRRQRGRR